MTRFAAITGSGGLSIRLSHVMRYAPVYAIFGGWSSRHPRRLPSIATAEHALFECGGIGKASNVTGLTIAKIERGLGDSSTARMPVRPDEIPVNLIYNLVGVRSDSACQQYDRNYYRPFHGPQPSSFQ